MRNSSQQNKLQTPAEVNRLMDSMRELFEKTDIIENRTENPSGEFLTPGRIWFRTDLA